MANPETDSSVSAGEDSLRRPPNDWFPSVMHHSDPDNLMACPICYIKYSHKEDAHDTPLVGSCGHSFCRACVKKWAEDKHEDEVECPLCRDGASPAFNPLEEKVNHGLVNMILGCVKAEREWCERHMKACYLPPNTHSQVVKVHKTFLNEQGVPVDFNGDARIDQDSAGGIHFHVVYDDGDDETVSFEELQVMAKDYVLKSELNTDAPKRKRKHGQARTETP